MLFRKVLYKTALNLHGLYTYLRKLLVSNVPEFGKKSKYIFNFRKKER